MENVARNKLGAWFRWGFVVKRLSNWSGGKHIVEIIEFYWPEEVKNNVFTMEEVIASHTNRSIRQLRSSILRFVLSFYMKCHPPKLTYTPWYYKRISLSLSEWTLFSMTLEERPKRYQLRGAVYPCKVIEKVTFVCPTLFAMTIVINKCHNNGGDLVVNLILSHRNLVICHINGGIWMSY
jgi:hypothetical protein